MSQLKRKQKQEKKNTSDIYPRQRDNYLPICFITMNCSKLIIQVE